MTLHDLHLISLAQSTLTDHAYIARLIPQAETDEARVILSDLESRAFRTSERIAFENYD